MKDEKLNLTVDDEAAGLRLDKAIALLSGISRVRARKCLAAGSVYLNNKRHKLASTAVRRGDRIEVHPGFENTAAEAETPEVLFEDKAMVIVGKPHGMPSAATRQADAGSLPMVLKKMLNLPHAPEPAHRLDLLTSGAIALGKTHQAALKIAGQFSSRTAGKHYIAVTKGSPPKPEGEIDAGIARHFSDPLRRMISNDRGKEAVTHYRLLGENAGAALLLLKPLTGRTHQIRLHLQHIGCPVLGDPVYGFAAGAPKMMLHAWRLKLNHPISGAPIAVTAKPPAWFDDWSLFLPDPQDLD